MVLLWLEQTGERGGEQGIAGDLGEGEHQRKTRKDLKAPGGLTLWLPSLQFFRERCLGRARAVRGVFNPACMGWRPCQEPGEGEGSSSCAGGSRGQRKKTTEPQPLRESQTSSQAKGCVCTCVDIANDGLEAQVGGKETLLLAKSS